MASERGKTDFCKYYDYGADGVGEVDYHHCFAKRLAEIFFSDLNCKGKGCQQYEKAKKESVNE